jgi:hypothetical protein
MPIGKPFLGFATLRRVTFLDLVVFSATVPKSIEVGETVRLPAIGAESKASMRWFAVSET